MTSIYSVDAAQQSKLQERDHRPPARDFAHELNKRDEESTSEPAARANTESESGTSPSTASAKAGLPVSADTEEATPAQIQMLALAKAEQVAQVAVTPVGITQALLGARVFGWHAMAQSYLSELTAADDAPVAQAPLEQLESASFDLPTQADAASPEKGGAVTIEETAPVSSPTEDVAPLQVSRVLEDVASSDTTALSGSDASAPAYWSERSLRFTRQRDGGRVAWARDFRISDAEASHLIQWIVSNAKAKGVALSKVMLNGREAWSSQDGQ